MRKKSRVRGHIRHLEGSKVSVTPHVRYVKKGLKGKERWSYNSRLKLTRLNNEITKMQSKIYDLNNVLSITKSNMKRTKLKNQIRNLEKQIDKKYQQIEHYTTQIMRYAV
jgi:chromosome segregation ATPase